MPLINLIQERRNALKQREGQARAVMFGSTAMVGLTFLAAGALMFQTGRAKANGDQMEAKIESMQPLVGQLQENEEQIEGLQPRITTLESAQAVTDRWNRILEHLTVHTPMDVHLTNVTSKKGQPEEPVQATFRGLSTSQDAVGALLLHMQLSDDMEGFALKYTQEKRVGDGSSIEFELVANVAGTAAEKPKHEDKEDQA